jgi:hypothetical protein
MSLPERRDISSAEKCRITCVPSQPLPPVTRIFVAINAGKRIN